MASGNVSISSNGGDNLFDAVESILNASEIAVLKSAQDAAKTVSNATVKQLKVVSPKGKSGKYAQGWTKKAQDGGYVVYNDKAAGLAHLLNNGHDVVNNGRVVGHVKGDNHITNVEKEMVEMMVSETQKELQRRLNS